MKAFRIVISDFAITEVLEQADWYADKAGRRMAKRWEDKVTASLRLLARTPRSGGLCNFAAQELRETRRIPVASFPKHLIFYQEQADAVLILRVVHGARDLESLFADGSTFAS